MCTIEINHKSVCFSLHYNQNNFDIGYVDLFIMQILHFSNVKDVIMNSLCTHL